MPKKAHIQTMPANKRRQEIISILATAILRIKQNKNRKSSKRSKKLSKIPKKELDVSPKIRTHVSGS